MPTARHGSDDDDDDDTDPTASSLSDMIYDLPYFPDSWTPGMYMIQGGGSRTPAILEIFFKIPFTQYN